MRERLHEIIQPSEDGDTPSRFYDIFITVVAIVSITPMLIRYDIAPSHFISIVSLIDAVTVLILLFDYEMRWITYDIKCKKTNFHDFKGNAWGWRAFIIYPFTLPALIDLIAILPTLIILPDFCNYLILLRLFKIFRVLKSLKIVKNVLIREGKTLLSVFVATLLYIFTTAVIMYTVEPDTFTSFLNAFYWSTTSLATIGYGDISPQTQLGKVINIISAIIGLGIIALPAGIITGGFVFEIRRLKELGLRKKNSSLSNFSIDEKGRDIAESIKEIIKERKINAYFNKNIKVKKYLSIISICILLDFLIYLLEIMLNPSGVIFYIDYLGTSLAAYLLEPAAGIVVGFFALLSNAIGFQNPSKNLYIGINILFALLFGHFISFDKKNKRLHHILILLIGVSIILVYNTIVSIAIHDSAQINGVTYHTFSENGSLNFIETLIFMLIYSAVILAYAIENYLIIYIVHRLQIRRKNKHTTAMPRKTPEEPHDNPPESHHDILLSGNSETKNNK